MDNLPARRRRDIESRRSARPDDDDRRLPNGLIVIAPVALFAASVACFALSVLMVADPLRALAILLLALSAVTFVAMPLVMMRRRDRR